MLPARQPRRTTSGIGGDTGVVLQCRNVKSCAAEQPRSRPRTLIARVLSPRRLQSHHHCPPPHDTLSTLTPAWEAPRTVLRARCSVRTMRLFRVNSACADRVVCVGPTPPARCSHAAPRSRPAPHISHARTSNGKPSGSWGRAPTHNRSPEPVHPHSVISRVRWVVAPLLHALVASLCGANQLCASDKPQSPNMRGALRLAAFATVVVSVTGTCSCNHLSHAVCGGVVNRACGRPQTPRSNWSRGGPRWNTREAIAYAAPIGMYWMDWAGETPWIDTRRRGDGPCAYFGGGRIPRCRASYATPVQRTMGTRWEGPLGWLA
jgi:hypothetical protein